MAEGFVSAQALHKRLVADGSSVGLSTVCRTLPALAEAGRADIFRDTNGERLFRHRPGPDHRHYLTAPSAASAWPSNPAPWRTGRTGCPDLRVRRRPARRRTLRPLSGPLPEGGAGTDAGALTVIVHTPYPTCGSGCPCGPGHGAP
ncbi:hypothetical protein GCM10010214_54650 [Streptomyces abikoensis]|nr:hypothetical protein GCM10010214_54650 [Streptomyces abikoensis]